MIIYERLARIEGLQRYAHKSPDDGLCLLEAAAWIAGELHSDRPECVDFLITDLGRQLNDLMPDDATRSRYLLPVLPDLIGTRADFLAPVSLSRWKAVFDLQRDFRDALRRETPRPVSEIDWSEWGPKAQAVLREMCRAAKGEHIDEVT
jgi:hypothetical protein